MRLELTWVSCPKNCPLTGPVPPTATRPHLQGCLFDSTQSLPSEKGVFATAIGGSEPGSLLPICPL